MADRRLASSEHGRRQKLPGRCQAIFGRPSEKFIQWLHLPYARFLRRYLSYTYLNDLEHGPYVNHYFSYLEPPDRCGDGTISMLSIYGTKKKDGSCISMAARLAAGPIPGPQDLRYEKESARGMLTAIPSAYWNRLSPEDTELARRDMELYRFFRHKAWPADGAMSSIRPFRAIRNTTISSAQPRPLQGVHHHYAPCRECGGGGASSRTSAGDQVRRRVRLDADYERAERRRPTYPTALRSRTRSPANRDRSEHSNRPGSGQEIISPESPGRDTRAS